MTQRPKTAPGARRPPAALPADDESLDTSDLGERIFSRPDGYYWLSADGKREMGPFSTYEQAEASLHADEHSDVEPDETLEEAESEIGIAGWIDPETGGPAEEERPRIEDR